MVSILVTGVAGFIGFHVAKHLLMRGDKVLGLDNLNAYYDVNLKEARLAQLIDYEGFSFVKAELQDAQLLNRSCELHQIDKIIHLAAQAGVRYSIEAPQEYIDSNITGFLNVLNVARDREVSHLIYASSSSVYGDHNEVPYSTRDRTDRPASIYAASKVANELMAHVYHEQFALSVTGLRFFTVYGPWGRPDMSPFIFLNALLRRETIRLFNNGDHSRDFTYIDDIVEGVIRVADDALVEPVARVYNIGRGEPVGLLDYVQVLEQLTGYEAITMLEPKQPGDVAETFADVTSLQRDFGYAPAISLEDGLKAFVNWYRAYYQV